MSQLGYQAKKLCSTPLTKIAASFKQSATEALANLETETTKNRVAIPRLTANNAMIITQRNSLTAEVVRLKLLHIPSGGTPTDGATSRNNAPPHKPNKHYFWTHEWAARPKHTSET
jgi:hypothetical protein